MERYRFWIGEYKYYKYPLPALVQQLREFVYPKLAPIANNWMQVLNIKKHFPEDIDKFLELCHIQNQRKPTPLIPKYSKGGYNTLHRDIWGRLFSHTIGSAFQ